MADVFTDETTEPGAQPTGADIKFADLVGEGKKFADQDALAKAKAEADRFIEQLKEENRALRESVTKESNAFENLKILQAKVKELEELAAKRSNSEPPGALDPSQLENLVASVITKQEQAKTASQNLAASNDALVQQYGSVEKAKEVMVKRADELGMSVAELKAIAAKSPTAFKQVMGVSEQKPAAKTPTFDGKTNGAVLPAGGSGPKPGTAAWYNQKRKEMGNTKFYADIKLQQQMFEHKKSGLYDS